MDFNLNNQQKTLIELVQELGKNKFAARASVYDEEASFPWENYEDLRNHGLLALCVPKKYGGMGVDFPSYCLISAEIARYCGATALTYNMHISSTLWLNVLNDLPLTESQIAECEIYKKLHFQRIVEKQALYSQPISEEGAGVSLGKAYQTTAKKVEEGWLINGKKTFASLSEAADYYGIVCTEETENISVENCLYIAIPAKTQGVQVVGEWNPLGMRATISRTLIFDNVFVPNNAQLLPSNIYLKLTELYPHMFFTLAPTYMGIAQAAYDFTIKYLRGEVVGMPPIKQRQNKIKQFNVAQMFIILEQTKAIFYRVINEAKINPSKAERLRAYAANYTVMENSNQLCSLAIRVCGGHSLLKSFPLERLYRDSRCGGLMRPWGSDRCLEKLGMETLYESQETDEQG
ncbi:MAG: BEC protein [Anabaena sp. MDT14b]|jgi:alkylation response protein AidB-like acyl-CoA dehydrogenase|nr:MAG: BEC protein [Anabaena sp. MDT14b]